MKFNNYPWRTILFVGNEAIGYEVESMTSSYQPGQVSSMFVGDTEYITSLAPGLVTIILKLENGNTFTIEPYAKYSYVKNDAKMQYEIRVAATGGKVQESVYSGFEYCTCEVCTNPPKGGRLPETEKLPGLTEKVKHPVNGSYWALEYAIIDLNDKYKWSREQIADWLETLDIDLRFK